MADRNNRGLPIRVVHVLGSGGREETAFATIVAALAQRLDRSTFDIQVLAMRDAGTLAAPLVEARVPVTPVHWSSRITDARGVARFVSYLRHARVGLLHQHFGGRAARLIGKAMGIPTVLHLHSRVYEDRTGVVRHSADSAAAVIATSRSVAELISGKSRVVYPGVDIEAVPARPERADGANLVVGTAGRVEPVKGIAVLLESFAILRRELPGVSLEIAGDGSALPEAKALADSLGISGAVSFLGWQDNISSVLGRWDIYVQPSLEEGFGLATLRAMASGLPVVATATGGTPELVEDGVSGLLVPPNDATAIAGAIARLARDAGARLAISQSARRRAELFSTQRMVDGIEAVYREVLHL